MLRIIAVIAVAAVLAMFSHASYGASGCDKACLEHTADLYRAAYLKHDAKLAPFARKVRFTENNVEMEFPDGTWDTVNEEVGSALTLSDPVTGNVGIYMAIIQSKDTPGFLAVRLKVQRGQISEVEHIISTRRNLSSPPTPIGDVREFKHDPDLAQAVPTAERISRERLIAHANGYFSTLQNNTGEIRGTRFAPDATRYENGLKFAEIEKGFKSRPLPLQRARARPGFLSGGRGTPDRDGAWLHRPQGRAGRVHAYRWHPAALGVPGTPHVGVPGDVQDQGGPDHGRRGPLHRCAVLHALALDAQARPALRGGVTGFTGEFGISSWATRSQCGNIGPVAR